MDDVLKYCIKGFGEPSRQISFWDKITYFRVPKPVWLRMSPQDEMWVHFKNMQSIYENGMVVWGHVIQANGLLFEEGRDDCPGELVYSIDRKRRIDPELLAEVAHKLYRLKGTQPHDANLIPIADYLTDQLTRVYGMKVPRSICPTIPCRISTTFFVRKHLPEQRLCKTLMPILVNIEKPHVVAPLPARYWPQSFIDWWSE
ncbi:MAG: hypothetical protein KDA78_07505 [Planctomycetaceae bacterium]|nr:hypothetical protein [Planctomycetaceae bacterium]